MEKRLTKKQISEWFSEWFNYFKGLEKEKKVKYFLALLLILSGATYYHFNINIGSTQINIQNNSGNNQINTQNNSGNNTLTIQNASLINSPIFQGSSNNTVFYNTNPITNTETESAIPNTLFYTKELSLYNSALKVNYYFVKLVLPDRQIAFLDEFLYNTRYNISLCNDEGTDCYIYSKFRVRNLTEDQVCWISTSRFSDKNLIRDKWEYGKKFLIDPDKCLTLIDERISGIRKLPDGRIKYGGVIAGMPSIVIQEQTAAEEKFKSGDYTAAFNHAQNAIKAYEDSKKEEFGAYFINGSFTPEGVSKIYIVGAMTAQKIGNKSLAYQYAKTALDAYDTPFNNAAVASTLFYLGNYTDALNYSKKALQAEPNNSWFIGLNNDILKVNAMQK